MQVIFNGVKVDVTSKVVADKIKRLLFGAVLPEITGIPSDKVKRFVRPYQRRTWNDEEIS